MERFGCPRCGSDVAFSAATCPSCGSELGYDPETRRIVVLDPGTDAETGTFRADGGQWWRCMNAAWGCNWILEAGSATTWCRSCRLTHGRPDTANPDAIAAWTDTEAHKRHLVHQLTGLGLPVGPQTADNPDGLRFELVYVPGQPAVTGHRSGTITIDLTEADDVHRTALRQQFDEPTRTVLGHLRHEIGHYYWPLLVEGPDELGEFRTLFGDERADYAAALRAHHADTSRSWDRTKHLTAYAAAHPAEDWAETFAHYLHLTDATDSAANHQLHVTLASSERPWTFAAVADRWRRTADAINAVAEALGEPPLYPYELTPAIIAKLAFVDRQVQRARP